MKEVSNDELVIVFSNIPQCVKVNRQNLLEDVQMNISSIPQSCTEEQRSKALSSLWKDADILNPHLVDYLVKRYGKPGLKTQMESFTSRLQHFRRNTPLCIYAKSHITPKRARCSIISKLLPKRGKHIKKDFKQLITIFDWKNASLEDAERVRKEHAPQYGLREFCVHLVNATCGSVMLEWLIPACLAADLRELIAATENEFFQEDKVTKVELDGVTLYSSKLEVYYILIVVFLVLTTTTRYTVTCAYTLAGTSYL